MKKHLFAALIYSVEKTLGLRSKARPTEEASKASFDSHRKELQTETAPNDSTRRLEKIFKLLHIGCDLPPKMDVNHFDIMESVYYALARQPNVLDVLYEDPIQNYISNALIPLICVDIYILKGYSNENSIYYHLDRILAMDNLATFEGNKQELRKTTAQKYVREYIIHHFNKHADILNKTNFKNKEQLIPELLNYLGVFYKKDNQTCAKLHEKLEPCNERLFSTKIDNSSFSIQPIIAAYTAIIILQDIANKTSMIAHFYNTYNLLIEKQSPILNDLYLSLHAALSENYEDLNLNESSIYLHDGNEPEIILSSKKLMYLEKITSYIFEMFGICTLSDSELDLMPLLVEESYLGKMVSLPPQFSIPMAIVDKDASLENKANHLEMHVISFDHSKVATIAGLMYKETNKFQKFFMQYIPLIEALDCIKHNEPDAALDIINNVQHEDRLSFGFIKHSLAVLKIGLMYILKPNSIKHQSLNEQVTDIINHQGIISIPVLASPNLLEINNAGWLSIPEYEECSIVSGGNTYNSVVAQAIYIYNFTVARHTPSRNPTTNEPIKNTSSLTHPNLNYSSSLIIRNLLKDLNEVSGKILAGLDKVSIDVDPKVPEGPATFANELVRENVVSREELNDNLIQGITGSSLGVCLLDYSTIILFLFVPGDDVANIIALGEKTNVVELLFRYRHPLPKEGENNSLNTKNASVIS